MTNKEFAEEIVAYYVGKFDEIANTKGKEYSNNDDRLANFKRLADKLGVTPELICWIYGTKHLDSIDHMVKEIQKTGNLPIMSEAYQGRILDALMYLMLLAGLIRERIHNSAINTMPTSSNIQQGQPVSNTTFVPLVSEWRKNS